MKKNIFTIALSTLGILAFAVPTFAATTVSLSPASINVAPGQNLNVVISVDPEGAKDYTEKVELRFPADTLEVKSFTLGDNWMALSQTGYDSVDNTDGVLVKTAGYPGGISSSTVFGTVSFYAKKAGSGTIQIGSDSLAYEINSQSALTGSLASFTIAAPVVPSPAPAPQNPAVTAAPAAGTSGNAAAKQNSANPAGAPALGQTNGTNAAPASQPNGQQQTAQLAAGASLISGVGGILTLRTGNRLVSILTILVLLSAVGYGAYTLVKKKQNPAQKA